MNYDIFKMKVKEAIKVEWKNYLDGNVQWNVSNQFDESYLESAYEEFIKDDDVTAMKCYATFNAEIPQDIMNLVYVASTFEVEPMAAGWTQ